MDKTRLIAPSLFAGAIGGNYALHKMGLPTLCDNTRRVAHTETLTGKIVVGGLWIGFNAVWFMPHLLLPKNQHHVVH